MKIINFIIVCISVVAISAFFMPWVKGRGSLTKPIDDTTKVIQDKEPTKVIKSFIKTTTGVVDTLTETLAPMRLKKTLRGYQIPISKETEDLSAIVYLLYVLPIMAIICAIFSILGNRKKLFDLIAILIALGVFILLYGQVKALSREGLFIKVQACLGFWLTMYSFLAISIATFMKLLISIKYS